jgi:hypothetical protein
MNHKAWEYHGDVPADYDHRNSQSKKGIYKISQGVRGHPEMTKRYQG